MSHTIEDLNEQHLHNNFDSKTQYNLYSRTEELYRDSRMNKTQEFKSITKFVREVGSSNGINKNVSTKNERIVHVYW